MFIDYALRKVKDIMMLLLFSLIHPRLADCWFCVGVFRRHVRTGLYDARSQNVITNTG